MPMSISPDFKPASSMVLFIVATCSVISLLLVKLADHRRQDPQRGGGQRADAHDVVIQALFAVQRLAGRIKGVKHLNGMRQKLFADQG